jgi:hypothetical protein
MALVIVLLASPSGVFPQSPPASGTQPIRVTPGLTLAQVLAHPDATQVILSDGRTTTVGELRRRAEDRNRAIATVRSGHFPLSGGRAASRSALGVSRARQVMDATVHENTLAVSLRTRPMEEATRAPAGTGAVAQSHLQPNRAGLVPTEGIGAVNGKSHGFVVSPGGYLTIAGHGFGDAIGQANVIGQFPNGAEALRVVEWRADEVYALLPPGLRGVLDQPVSIQLVTRVGKTYRIDHGEFVATREDITLTSQITRIVRFQSGSSWPARLEDDGSVTRGASADSMTCASPGTDILTTVDPGRGFVVTGLTALWGRTDSGDHDADGYDGSRTFFPGYGFGSWQGDSIGVSWGVWRSHTSPDFLLSSFDMCESNYQVAVVLTGPAGVSPF